MKIVKSVLLASALCASLFSLSGCSQTAKSQPVVPSETASATQNSQMAPSPSAQQWNGRLGQECVIYLAQNVDGNRNGVAGTLLSVTNDWVVVSGKGTEGIGKDFVRLDLDLYVPISNISYVKFSKETGKP